MEKPEENIPPYGRKKTGAFWLTVILVVLIAGNVWLAEKTFSGDGATTTLPKLKINMLSASSFVIKNTKTNTKLLLESPKNILVLGKSGEGYIAPELTDTILIVHIDPYPQQTNNVRNDVSKGVRIISIPRDLAVKLPNSKSVTKINGLYQLGLKTSEKRGLELIKNKVEEVTGLGINNFILFNLKTAEKVIDDIGGINVNVKNDIYDTRFPTDKGYEIFKLKSGYRFLDGETALKFVRTRNSLRGDFERIERQQEVLKAIKGKLASLNPIWDFSKLWAIFRTVQQDVRTDLSISEIRDFWFVGKNIEMEQIKTFSINGESGLVVDKKMNLGGVAASVLIAKDGDFEYTDIKSAINNFLQK